MRQPKNTKAKRTTARRRASAAVAGSMMVAAVAQAIGVGDPLPSFEAQSTRGPIRSEDLKGRWVVVFFYPKAFTPGCTKESCSLRDAYSKLADLGVTVLGVSVDKLETQQKFKEKYQLPYDLIADDEKKVSAAFGVLAPLKAYASRRTFVISPDGRVVHVVDQVSVDTHGEDLVELVRKLQAQTRP